MMLPNKLTAVECHGCDHFHCRQCGEVLTAEEVDGILGHTNTGTAWERDPWDPDGEPVAVPVPVHCGPCTPINVCPGCGLVAERGVYTMERIDGKPEDIPRKWHRGCLMVARINTNSLTDECLGLL